MRTHHVVKQGFFEEFFGKTDLPAGQQSRPANRVTPPPRRAFALLAAAGGLITSSALLGLTAPSASAAGSCGRTITDHVNGQGVLSGDDTTNITITKAGSAPDNNGYISIRGNGLNGIVITGATYTATGPVTKTLTDGLFQLYTTNDGTGSDYITSVTITACDTTAPTPSPTPTTTATPTPATTATPAPSSTTTTPSTVASTTTPATATATATTAGSTETVAAAGFTPGEKVLAELHSTLVDLGTYTANSAGIATVTFTVPVTLETGSHTVVLTGLTSGHVATAHFTVQATSTELASTGVNYTEQLLTFGGGAIILGAGALFITTRSRRAGQLQ